MNLFDIAVARKLSGGGGGGDVSIAKCDVSITNNGSNDGSVHFYYPIIDDDALVIEKWVELTAGETTEFELDVIMYKGEAILYYDYTFEFSSVKLEDDIETTGNASYADGIITITGDCTITFPVEDRGAVD